MRDIPSDLGCDRRRSLSWALPVRMDPQRSQKLFHQTEPGIIRLATSPLGSIGQAGSTALAVRASTLEDVGTVGAILRIAISAAKNVHVLQMIVARHSRTAKN